MIKFLATDPTNGRKILAMGLSHGNIGRLMEGKPIHFNIEQMGLSALRVNEVVIFAGDTEESMKQELEDYGLLDGYKIVEEDTTKQ